MLNKHCSDAIWMLQNNRPLWRGDKSFNKGNFFTADPSLTTRVSQNTSNHYTLILDNIPSMKRYPKRSKSFIATTSYRDACMYTDDFDPYSLPHVLVPYNGVRIGSTDSNDMWGTHVEIGDEIMDLESFNDLMLKLKIKSNSWNNMLASAAELAEKIKENGVPKNLEDYFDRMFKKKDLIKFLQSFEENVNRIFDPKRTKFSSFTTANFKWKRETEMWIGGPCIIISEDMWGELRKAL